jgi:hypothetical protein
MEQAGWMAYLEIMYKANMTAETQTKYNLALYFVQLNVTYLAMPYPGKGNLNSTCHTEDADTTLQFQDEDNVIPKT